MKRILGLAAAVALLGAPAYAGGDKPHDKGAQQQQGTGGAGDQGENLNWEEGYQVDKDDKAVIDAAEVGEDEPGGFGGAGGEGQPEKKGQQQQAGEDDPNWEEGYQVDKDDKAVIDAAEIGEDQPGGFGGAGEQGQPGQQQGKDAMQGQQQQLEGQVLKVERNKLFLTYSGAVVEFKLDKSTEFGAGLKSAKDLKEGQQVRAQFNVKNQDNMAKKITLPDQQGRGGSGY